MANKNNWTPFTQVGIQTKAEGPVGIVFENNRYRVTKREHVSGMVHLSVSDLQRTTLAHDWRHFQRIKNELAGPEMEAVELYPAESRKVDGANQYHLWAFPKGKFDFGFAYRLVTENPAYPGVTQRPFESEADFQHEDYQPGVIYGEVVTLG